MATTQEPSGKEKIEGLDQDEDASLGDYPLDTVLIRNEQRTVRDVLYRIANEGFIMDPEFQRDFESKPGEPIYTILSKMDQDDEWGMENTFQLVKRESDWRIISHFFRSLP